VRSEQKAGIFIRPFSSVWFGIGNDASGIAPTIYLEVIRGAGLPPTCLQWLLVVL
jgi:hypothetical protein